VTFRNLKGKVVIANDTPVGGIKIGFGNVGIIDKKYDRCIWENCGIVEFKGKASIGMNSRIACSGHLEIGDGCHFNGGSDIICWDNMQFGANCLISWNCLFMDTDFHDLHNKNDLNTVINPNEPIKIGDHVWIGCRTTVLKGATIPEGSVVGACSVVTKQLNVPNAVYISNECTRESILW
jgi:acetyltransferase-like isoleucine patch superfamily enzyme